ncbi:hypothetical protein D9M72_574560 [compost metagenome]
MVGDMGAEAFAVASYRACRIAAEVLADRHELHLRRDDAGAGVGKLRYRLAASRLERRVLEREGRRQPVAAGKTVVFRTDDAPLVGFHVAAPDDPVATESRQPRLDADLRIVGGIGAGGIVDGNRRLAGGRVQRDLAHRHADIRVEDA